MKVSLRKGQTSAKSAFANSHCGTYDKMDIVRLINMGGNKVIVTRPYSFEEIPGDWLLGLQALDGANVRLSLRHIQRSPALGN